jgi:hypothetical protein
MSLALPRAAALVLLASAAAAGCSWRRAGEADAVAPATAGVPLPSEGMTLGEAIAVVETEEPGDFSISAEVLRVAKIAGGIWEDVSTRAARRPDFAPAADAEYVVVARRTCSDWATTRDRWSDDRASWFLFAGGKLVAFDHWTFGPRCALGNAFAPVPAGSPNVVTERDLLRWLEQRHPPGKIPMELRFARGRAFAAAGRLPEARAILRFSDDALDYREDVFEVRESTEEERSAFDAESRRLRDLRADLSTAIREAEARAAGAP